MNVERRWCEIKARYCKLLRLQEDPGELQNSCAGICGITAVAITAIPLVSGIFYSIPLLPRGFKYRRLKDIPFVKNFIVGLAWAIPIALLPVVFTGFCAGRMTVAVGLFFFFFLSFVNSTVFDIRDVEGDAESGVQTIPVIIGIRSTRILLSVMNLISSVVVLVFCKGYLSPVETAIIAGIAIYVQGYIILFNGNRLNRIMYDLVADGQYLLLGELVCLS
ncbi:MAG: UbiA family prenyltransferase [Euryarchaeota archaeon]|nr:UbiA family prenyltransferase [Euryarchaeota archaeon]